MAEKTEISWTDHTFNPWIGCTKVSPGCANCYAETLMDTRYGRVKWGKGNPRSRTSEANWKLPLRWNKVAELNQDHHWEASLPYQRPRVFCASLADWLDDEVPIEWLADLLKLIHDTPNLDWLLLTKRSENWRSRIEGAQDWHFDHGDRNVAGWLSDWRKHNLFPENVWIGTTVENQEMAEKRIPVLRKIPALFRFLSCEPLLGPVNLGLLGEKGGSFPPAAHAMGMVTANLAPFVTEHANASNQRNMAADEPLRTQCSEVKGGHFAAVTGFLNKYYGEKKEGETRGQEIETPLHTQPTENRFGVVSATLIGAGGPARSGEPRPVDQPEVSILTDNNRHLVTAHLVGAGGPEYSAKPTSVEQPMGALLAENHKAVVSAQLVGVGGRAGQSRPRDVNEPVQTVTAKGDTGVVAANLIRHFGESTGSTVDAPAPTVMGDGLGKTGVVASHLSKMYGTTTGSEQTEPMPTVTGGGNHIAEVRAFLIKYYGNEKEAISLTDPMHTVTAKDRIGLVTVGGTDWAISDIGMRILEPRELFLGQGFPRTYIIAPVVDGRRGWRPLSKAKQVKAAGNSVCPHEAKALVAANFPEMSTWGRREKKLLEAA